MKPKTKPAPFAARLRELRERAGLSIIDLAKLCGLTRQAIWQFEAAQRQPTLASAKAVAKALGVSVEALG